MSNCNFLVHPLNNQSINVSVNKLVPVYNGINTITYNENGNILTTLKPFSNLFVLEAKTGFNNLEPVGLVIEPSNSLPNGLGLYKYNTITGKPITTGRWTIGVQYVYNTGSSNLYTSPLRYFNINVQPTGVFIDNPIFNVITDENKNQLFPINSGGNILIPITGNSGQGGYIDSGFLASGTGCLTTLSSGSLLPFNFCITGSCPQGQICRYEDSTGITQEGGAEEPSQGGQKGDPINVLPLRIVSNDMLNFDGSRVNQIGSGCNFYTSLYIDGRDRTENFFLGRIGNRYVRVDTTTWSDPKANAFGVLRGINITKGLIHSINTNREITSYTETEGTMYYVSLGSDLPSWVGTVDPSTPTAAFAWGNLYQLDKGGAPIPVINTPAGFLRGFFVEKNIGIEDVTALRLSWCYGLACANFETCTPTSLDDGAFVGGQLSFTFGELFRFDEIGGSLVENMQFNYNNVNIYYKQSGASTTVHDISDKAPWPSWGSKLKFVDINDRFKHFYGLDWAYTRHAIPSNTDWAKVITPSGTFSYSLSNDYNTNGNCVLSIPCLPCDPACPCFTGHAISEPNRIELCDHNNQLIPRWLCECYRNFTLDDNNPNPSTSSSLTPEMFMELIN
jgi:hypothetical protein